MRSACLVALMGLLFVVPMARAAQDPAEAKPGEGEKPVVEPKPADGDAPLPVGFPTGTKPGVIEIKSYPAYRSAVAQGEGMTTGSGDFLFWSLFRHIETKGVAMTAPVINTYESDQMIAEPSRRGRVTMEFLYGRPDQGEAGQGVGAVKVVDHPAGQYLCLGIQGAMGEERMKTGLEELRQWLASHKDEWVEAGPPRRLGYHGPMTPSARRLWELQIPVKPAGPGEDGEAKRP